MPSIYEPAEDSYLMSKALEERLPMLLAKNRDLRFLEIGCGSGIGLQMALKAEVKKNRILGVDINKKAVEHCRKLGFISMVSDLFENVKGKFDVIAFNPPYLPVDESEPKNSRVVTTGGKKGNEMIIKFLTEAKEHLAVGGKIFLITSSLAEEVDFDILGYMAKEIDSVKMFFEKLSVWELNLYMN